MIERLVIALRELAATEREELRDEALASDFDDAHFLLSQCQQLEITARQRDALADVERSLLQARSKQGTRRTADWAAVRAAATIALRELGYGADSRAG